MNHLQQDRKTDLANYFIQLLNKMNLPLAAGQLSQQALPTSKRNIQQDINQIMTMSGASQEAKKDRLGLYFKREICKNLKNGLIEDAVNLLQNYVSLYFQHLEEFCTLFAWNQQTAEVEVSQLFQDFLVDSKDIPEQRVASHKFNNQIWFVKALGDKVVVIDQKSNGKIIRGNQILTHRNKLHEGTIYCLTSKKDLCFATGGQDKICRVWNSRFQNIYETAVHQAKINCIVFLPVGMITFDSNGLSVIHKSISKPDSIRKLKMKTIVDAKYMNSRKLLITLCHQGKQSELNYVDLEQTVSKKHVPMNGRSYNIELSKCQKIVFVNMAEMQIHAYSTKSHLLKYRFSGYLQKNFLMRMSVGGSKGHLLAVTSEDGQVCIFNLNHLELISKLKVSNTAVNCVTWINEQLYMGYDNGYVQIWSPDSKRYNEMQLNYSNKLMQNQKMSQQKQSFSTSATNFNRNRIQSQQTQ